MTREVHAGPCKRWRIQTYCHACIDQTNCVGDNCLYCPLALGHDLTASSRTCKHVNAPLQVLQKAIAGIKRLIEAERQGEAVDRQLLAHLLRMTSALGIYEDSFQTVFLASTELFYRAESQRMIQEVEVAAYLQHCEVGQVSSWTSMMSRKAIPQQLPLTGCTGSDFKSAARLGADMNASWVCDGQGASACFAHRARRHIVAHLHANLCHLTARYCHSKWAAALHGNVVIYYHSEGDRGSSEQYVGPKGRQICQSGYVPTFFIEPVTRGAREMSHCSVEVQHPRIVQIIWGEMHHLNLCWCRGGSRRNMSAASTTWSQVPEGI